MSLVLNEEQSYLKDTARDFAKNKTPVSHFTVSYTHLTLQTKA